MATIYKPVEDYITEAVAELQRNGSSITDFTVGSAARTLIEAQALNLSQQSLIADQLRRDMFLATATDTALDDKAADFLVYRNAAVQATGSITITIPGGASAAILIPAGFSPLSTAATPGGTPVAVYTTSDVTIPLSGTTATVPAQALVGGAVGNIATDTPLYPSSPVAGIDSATGWKVASPGFTNGADAETDEQLRTRVPIVVQGRVTGSRAAYLAAALSVPGVTSANVLTSGQARGDASTVPVPGVEVYFKGTSSLTAAVQSAVANAAVLNAGAVVGRTGGTAGPAAADRLILSATVTVPVGTDTAALAVLIAAAAADAVNNLPIGGVVYQAAVIQAINQASSSVIAVNVPLTKLCRFGFATAGDVTEPGDTYPALATGDVTLAFLTI